MYLKWLKAQIDESQLPMITDDYIRIIVLYFNHIFLRINFKFKYELTYNSLTPSSSQQCDLCGLRQKSGPKSATSKLTLCTAVPSMGNGCRRLLKSTDILQAEANLAAQPFVAVYKSLNVVVNACFGIGLS